MFSLANVVSSLIAHLFISAPPCRQGFRWYGRRLRIDEDGDVADEFLDEVLPLDRSGSQQHTTLPRFEVKYNTRPAPVRKQAIAINGNVHPSMEYKGMLRWV